MSRQSLTAVRSQAGFTLVELAVVMIIIGLLIGGVLKGQELIGNAQITSTVAQVKGIDAATSTFRDMYSAIPGDMLRPGDRLPNCTTVGGCDTQGNGNNRLETSPAADPTGEALRFFVHLSAADVITGINPSGAETWGGVYPESKIGGGFQPGYSNGTAADFANTANAANALGGHYLTLTSTPGAASAAGTGIISPNQAFRVDSKIDDGNGSTGGIRSFGTNCDTTGVYDEQSPNKVCGLHIRFQG